MSRILSCLGFKVWLFDCVEFCKMLPAYAAIMFKGRVKHYYSHDDRLSISALGETCGICSFETVKQGPWRRFCPVKAKTICQFRSKYWSQFIFMLEPQLPHLPLMQQRHNMKMSSHTALWVSVHNTCRGWAPGHMCSPPSSSPQTHSSANLQRSKTYFWA